MKLLGGSKTGLKAKLMKKEKKGGGGVPHVMKTSLLIIWKARFFMKAGSNFKAATDNGQQGRALAIAYSRHRRQGGPAPVATRKLGGDRIPGRAPDCMKAGETNKQTQQIIGRRTQQRTLGSVSDSSWVCCSQIGQEKQNCGCLSALSQ